MKTITLVVGASYGMLSVILGAFGAHAFKKVLSVDRLESFETGVRYQMFAALFLLIIGWIFKFETGTERWISLLMIFGTLLFSLSIYLLAFQDVWGISLKALGPITPLGGVLMIVSWGMLMWYFMKMKF